MKRLRLFLVLVLGLSLVPVVLAKEGGDQYPNGSENWFAGATPPPGLTYVNYFGYYSGQLKDGAGNKVVGPNGLTPQVDATFDAIRVIAMTKYKIFGADYGVHVIVPLVDQSMNFEGIKGMKGRSNMLSLGDITIDPIILGWHHPNWHVATGVDINLPTGHFDKSDPRVSVGANYYSFEPILAFSLLPKSGWEASTKLMYNLKTTNQATDYHSGQDFHMDYLAGKHIGGLMVGASGYVLEQTTDDTQKGVMVPAGGGFTAGNRGQVVAVGPSLGYTSKRHMSFILQWQHETVVENRFGGEKLWFKVMIPTGSGGPKS
jgi:hypothetical protein